MSTTDPRSACNELLWSLWTELGIPGASRRHAELVIDPEPVVLFTPTLIGPDLRLHEQVVGWCASNGARLSKSRLNALWKLRSEPTQRAFDAFAAAMKPHGVAWSFAQAASSESWRWVDPPRSNVATNRPSMLAFRTRGLCGVGMKADVLRCLLAHENSERPLSASDLAFLGFSRRRISATLDDLEQAHVVRRLPSSRSDRFVARNADALRTALDWERAPHTASPDWAAILGISTRIVHFIERFTEAPSSTSAAVEAERLTTFLDEQWMPSWGPLPGRSSEISRRGDDVISWGTAFLDELAAGTAGILGRR